MQNTFQISDESGDHKYFTMIPNYIVNHSTVYEQAIYLYMKRVAGESGTCWTSAQEIGKKLGIARRTVATYRDKLVKRGWIELVGKRGKTKPTDEYRIVDLWKLNVDFYASQKESIPSTQSPAKKITPQMQKIVHVGHLESDPNGHKEERIKKNTEEDTSNASVAGEKATVINDLIETFKNVNPSWRKFFPNKTQRDCLQRLLDQNGLEKVQWLIKSLPASNKTAYAPTITTPFQLEERLGSLNAFWQKQKSRKEQNNDVVKVA